MVCFLVFFVFVLPEQFDTYPSTLTLKGVFGVGGVEDRRVLQPSVQCFDCVATPTLTGITAVSRRRSIGEVSTTSSVSNNPTSDETLHNLLELSESQFDSVHVDTDPAKYVPNADY